MTDPEMKFVRAAAGGAKKVWSGVQFLGWLRNNIMLGSVILIAVFLLAAGELSAAISLMVGYFCLRYLYISPFRMMKMMGQVIAVQTADHTKPHD